LTSSLVQLMPALGGLSSMQSANLLNQSMINLMNSLKGAFAPSIWGVFLTILSVIIFSYYLKDNCLPVKILLDQTTLINWIPLLYPTASQKLQESLVTSERQLHQNIEAAQKVAEYAISIREEAGLLANNITQANLSLQQISEQSDSIEKFYESVNSLTSFQTQIKELYDQLIKESSVFQKDTTKSLNRLDKFVNNLFANLESQNGQIQNMLSALKLYEQGYINYRNEYDSSTRELLKSMIGAVEQMETRNKDLIKELGEPLNNLLVDKLSFLQKEQADHWQEILERFNSMNVPMEKAASIIEISLENATKRTEAITLELQRQYASQAEASVKQNETVIKLLSKITNEITNGTFNPSEDAVSEPIDKLTFRQKIGRMIRNGGSKVG
jgi:tRNA isopentenyl-2-thiomethyl-A-37 hydroxylase MiaE